jgi:hypothetical protein
MKAILAFIHQTTEAMQDEPTGTKIFLGLLLIGLLVGIAVGFALRHFVTFQGDPLHPGACAVIGTVATGFAWVCVWKPPKRED